MHPVRRVLLLGQMGAGKSSVGRQLADRLGWPYLDNDAELRRRVGSEASALATLRGLDRLHAVERAVLDALLREPVPFVVSGAASVVDTLRPVDLPADAFVVWLRAEPAELARRSAGAGHRPRGLETEPWFRQTRERDARGAALADLVVVTDARDTAAVLDEVHRSLPEQR